MTNTDPETGVRYGVIACNSLDQDLLDILWYERGANLSEIEARKDIELEVNAAADDIEEEACGSNVMEGGCDEEIEAAYKHFGFADREEYVNYAIQRELAHLSIEEPVIEGEFEGVSYRITWLGGAPILFVLKGPVGYCNFLCSPCIPNAGDLDSGIESIGYECYVVPKEWLHHAN